MKKVVILFGGTSSEYEVSCKSAVSIRKNIDREEYQCIMIGISKVGQWWLTTATDEQILNGLWAERDDNLQVTLNFGKGNKNIYILENNSMTTMNIDCIFPVVHGKYGEDGAMQGVLELSGIPYVGSGVETSAIAFDKAATKSCICDLDIKQAKCVILEYSPNKKMTEYCEIIETHLGNKYPLFVKPAREGSSVGISKVKRSGELITAIKKGFAYDNKLIVEEGVEGREIEVAILETLSPKASPIGEILTEEDFYSYEAKYNSTNSKTRIVNDIPDNLEKKIQETALQIYKRLECRGLARVDFFLKEDGEFIFNEINTLPGFTPISMYPKLWENHGIGYSELISILIEDAINLSNK